MPQVTITREHIEAQNLTELQEEYGRMKGCPLYKAIKEQCIGFPLAVVSARTVREVNGTMRPIKHWNGWADLLNLFETGKPIVVEF